MQETSEMRAGSLGWVDPLEGMATHSSILAWRIPWIDKPWRIQSMWLQRVGHNWASEHIHIILVSGLQHSQYFYRLYFIYSYYKILAILLVSYNASLYIIYFIHNSSYSTNTSWRPARHWAKFLNTMMVNENHLHPGQPHAIGRMHIDVCMCSV